jgi:adenosylcobinamide kinase/adenosylcobinamide-phosphate guanylyltransferase
MAEKTGRVIFVIGGARSGKSSFALNRASGVSGKKAYIATAQALDAEMDDRIKKHKQERGNEWDTIEEPFRLAETIKEISGNYETVIIDCLTLWLSNLMLGDKDVEEEMRSFISSLATVTCSLFTVSNEVGMGIVPDNALSRRFRDLAGHLNQKVARIADEVYLVTAGIPLRIKP